MDFDPYEESLLAELHLATSGSNAPGVDQIIIGQWETNAGEVSDSMSDNYTHCRSLSESFVDLCSNLVLQTSDFIVFNSIFNSAAIIIVCLDQ